MGNAVTRPRRTEEGREQPAQRRAATRARARAGGGGGATLVALARAGPSSSPQLDAAADARLYGDAAARFPRRRRPLARAQLRFGEGALPSESPAEDVYSIPLQRSLK